MKQHNFSSKFSNFNHTSVSTGGFANNKVFWMHSLEFLIQQIWVGTQEFIFPTGSHVTLMQGPQSENHSLSSHSLAFMCHPLPYTGSAHCFHPLILSKLFQSHLCLQVLEFNEKNSCFNCTQQSNYISTVFECCHNHTPAYPESALASLVVNTLMYKPQGPGVIFPS